MADNFAAAPSAEDQVNNEHSKRPRQIQDS